MSQKNHKVDIESVRVQMGRGIKKDGESFSNGTPRRQRNLTRRSGTIFAAKGILIMTRRAGCAGSFPTKLHEHMPWIDIEKLVVDDEPIEGEKRKV